MKGEKQSGLSWWSQRKSESTFSSGPCGFFAKQGRLFFLDVVLLPLDPFHVVGVLDWKRIKCFLNLDELGPVGNHRIQEKVVRKKDLGKNEEGSDKESEKRGKLTLVFGFSDFGFGWCQKEIDFLGKFKETQGKWVVEIKEETDWGSFDKIPKGLRYISPKIHPKERQVESPSIPIHPFFQYFQCFPIERMNGEWLSTQWA